MQPYRAGLVRHRSTQKYVHRLLAVIPGSTVTIVPHGAGDGLLIFGESDDASIMAAQALLAIVKEHRNRRL